MNKIVVTGIGCISALGSNQAEFRENLFNGVCGIGLVERIEIVQSRTTIAAEVKNFNEASHFQKKQLAQLDRYSQFALVASREAVSDAGLDFSMIQADGTPLAERTAVVYGTGIGGQNTQDESYQKLYKEGAKKLHPFTVPKVIPSASSSHISMEFGITGPALNTATACASSAHAMGIAMMMLRSGMIDVAITGGAEASITPAAFSAWESLRILAKDTCRPFSGKRGGMVLGEGAGTLILETLEHAERRGATIYAELAGVGMCSDAHQLVQPCAKGMSRAMQLALHDAHLDITDIDYINAHGTGTPQNDPLETSAIRSVFNEHADKLLVSSTKSMHGHVLGATSALEAVATIAAIQAQRAPATIGFIERDPACDLDYVFDQSRPLAINSALSNSFAFGGLNAVLAFNRFDGNQ